MFQRERMQNQQLSPGDWNLRVGELAQEWRELPEVERAFYSATAMEEDALRKEASRQPFHGKAGARGLNKPDSDAGPGIDAVSQLSAKTLKTVSCQRCLQTYKEYKLSKEWGDFDAGISNADGALKLDAIDLDSTDIQIEELWSAFARAPAEKGSEPTAASDVHHLTCFAKHGFCPRVQAQSGLADAVGKAVTGLAHHLERRALLKGWVLSLMP